MANWKLAIHLAAGGLPPIGNPQSAIGNHLAGFRISLK